MPADAGHKRRYEDGAVEVYSERRFFTVTGKALDDTPLLILERQAELDQVRQKVWGDDRQTAAATETAATTATATKGAGGAVSSIALPTCGVTNLSDDDILAHCRNDATDDHFRAVYDDGDLIADDDDDDDSVADFFVWNKHAFYVGNDPERIARLAEGGAHYRRPDDPTEASARQRKWQRPYPP